MLLPARHLPIRPSRFIITFALIFAFIWWHSHVLTHTQPVQIADALEGAQEQLQSGHASLANATLGFQTVIAISSEDQSSPTAWRQRGLLAAAKRTGLEVNIRQSRRIPDDELATFRARASPLNRERPPVGSARAWIAHLDALRHVVAQNISTALILEDDADWDVRIRSQLAPDAGIPRLIREILGYKQVEPGAGIVGPDNSTLHLVSPPMLEESPYTRDFDLIAFGHCTAITTPFSTTLTMDEEDTTLLPAQRLRALDDRYAYTPLPNFTRRVIKSPHPTCTYAYGVTLKGAQKLLERLGNGGGAAFDNEVGGLCWGNGRRKKPKKNGADPEGPGQEEQHDGLRCVAVSPEVIHAQRLVLDGNDEDGDTSLVEAQNREGWAADSMAVEQISGAAQGEELKRSNTAADDHPGHDQRKQPQKQLDIDQDRYSDPDSHGWRLWGIDVKPKLQKEKEEKRKSHFFTMNIMYSARCNAHVRPEEKLVQCLPTDEELDRYTT